MKSITIHNLDDRTAKLIELKARESGLSLNKTIKRLLHKALGISPEGNDPREDFREFLGVWSEEEFDQFQKGTTDFGKVDQEDWQ